VVAGRGSSSIPPVVEAAEIRALVDAAARGEQSAWDELVDAFAGLVWSVIRSFRLYGADAADVSQTVWLRMVEHVGRLRDPERAGAWLATTARNECLRVLRKTGRQVAMAEVPETVPASDHDVARGLVAAEDHDAFVRALDRVPARCQTLLRLLVADPPLSYDEIADLLDMPKGSIGPTRGRCLDHLRAVMGAVSS
jgi:RNA polymerase sigma factor (sigma-70 family)